MKKKLFKFISQIIPVMIGVLLAFLISNWSESNKQNERATIFMKSVKNEIESNSTKIKQIFPYHTMLKDSSSYYLRAIDTMSNFTRPNYFRGLRTPQLSKSAFNTGTQTGIISDFELNIIQQLNELYASQDDFNEYGKFSLEGLINLSSSDTLDGYKKVLNYISMITTDMFYMERELLQEYNEVEKLLSKF